MNEEFTEHRSAVLAAATALSVGDAVGYAYALENLPPIEGYRSDNDVDADKAIFSGSGVAN